MDNKLIEAAEIAAARAALEPERTIGGVPLPVPNYTKIARAAILAFLEAAAVDDSVVNAMAVEISFFVDGYGDPAPIERQRAKLDASKYRSHARAALSALKTEVKP